MSIEMNEKVGDGRDDILYTFCSGGWSNSLPRIVLSVCNIGFLDPLKCLQVPIYNACISSHCQITQCGKVSKKVDRLNLFAVDHYQAIKRRKIPEFIVIPYLGARVDVNPCQIGQAV